MAALFLAGSWFGQRKAAGQNATGNRPISHYVDPMNPAHTSPKPGLAPCGMKMEPVYAESPSRAPGAPAPQEPDRITPKKQQTIGVRVAAVANSPWNYTFRTAGKVAVDDTRTYRLNAFIEGWAVKVFNPTAGSLVKRDEPLATYYNRDLPTILQTFYYSIDARNLQENGLNLKEQELSPSQKNLLLAQRLTAEGVLLNLGMSKLEIDTLVQSRQLLEEITIFAPATSIVLARNITPGQKFAAGDELYRLADLSRVWILADMKENEADYIRPGEKVTVLLPDRAESHTATLGAVLPLFDPETQTVKVRLEVDNPHFVLTPGMIVDVEFPITMPASINVPIGAVMDSGLGQTVFIDQGNGFFEPRRVTTGWRLGGRVEILEGLKPGERIAVSGNFLIDSESRMKLATSGFSGPGSRDSVCGLDAKEAGNGHANQKGEPRGKTVDFCSDAGHDDHVVSRPLAHVTTEMIKDPVCGLEVDKGTAKQAGRVSEYQGQTYFFDTDGCKQRFDYNPQLYLSRSGNNPLASPTSHLTYPKVETVPNPVEQYRRRLRQSVIQETGRPVPQLPIQKLLPEFLPSGTPQAATSSIPPKAPAISPGTIPVKPQGPQTPPLQPQAPQ